MANDFLDLAEVVKFRDTDQRVGVLNDILDATPVLAAMAAKPVAGYQNIYLKRTTEPVTGFRAENDGREVDHTGYTKVTEALGILDATSRIDVAVAKSDPMGWQHAVSMEAMSHLRSAFKNFEDQLLNNTDGTNGFTGFAGFDGLNAVADAMVYNAGGVTGTDQSSVWLIKTGIRDCILTVGNDGMIDMEPTTIQQVAGTTGFYDAYITPAVGWVGVQAGSAYSVGRIANLDDTATLTDDIISNGLSLFPANERPDLIVMSKRELKYLQQSRTATNVTGAPAPFPSEAFGIPIVVSDQVSITEAVLA